MASTQRTPSEARGTPGTREGRDRRRLLRRLAVAGVAGAAFVPGITAHAAGAAPADAPVTTAEACNVWTQLLSARYTVTDSSEAFLSIGAISTANRTSGPINLYQSLSTTQTLTASGNIGLSYSGFGGSLGASYSLSWELGQGIGPYAIAPGETGRATYGFNVVRFTGTAQWCMPWGQWSSPLPIVGVAPLELHVVIERYPNGEAPPVPVGIPIDQAMNGLIPMAR
ncbi:MAG TPA: hypothetical protein VIL36_11860 [Acidimicrobiales bacterium]